MEKKKKKKKRKKKGLETNKENYIISTNVFLIFYKIQ